ncbi:hypothetical protein HUJ05_004736 [Dendroctonus ponderosae]|nr:hypothetical protein HUJ05_004736 [Dendroctonus ponderosae]
MFFQISPGVQKRAKCTVPRKVNDEESRVEVVSLAPFTASPKLEFNNVLAGTAATRKLLVKNPTGFDIDLFIEKHMPDEMDVVLSWSECKLQKGTNRLLEVTWRPVKEEVCRHKLVFCDGQQMNKNIFIIFRSVELTETKVGRTVKKNNSKAISCQLTRKTVSPTKKFSSQRNSSKMPTASTSRSKIEKENVSPCFSKQPLQYSITNVSNVKSFVDEKVWMFQTKGSVMHGLPPFESAFADPRRETFTVRPPLMPSINIDSPQKKSPDYSFGTKNSLSDTKQIFAINTSNELWDSLESPLLRKGHARASTPSLEQLLISANADNYERRSNRDGCDSLFTPLSNSTTRKPASIDISLENSSNVANFFGQAVGPVSQSLLNVGTTCLKSNVSTETYVVNNCSSDTFLKTDLSGGTYVKDESVNILDVSPCTTGFSLQIGNKRKSSIIGELPSKRERFQTSSVPAFRLSKSTSGLNLRQFSRSSGESRHNRITCISETTNQTVIIKNPFLYANIIDPFMTYSIYSNENWFNQQEKNFEKWLNTLLTPPKGLDAKSEIDIAKVWQACTTESVPLAPSKEKMSVEYHTNKKLYQLRKQAQNLFRSKQMSDVLQKVCLVVETGKLSIRSDMDIHLNLKLKSNIIRLLLGYNPLWLRIGLETIYNEVIPLRSNSDSQGLANFLLERFLKDPYLLKKYKSMYAPNYSSEVKKMILKRFLILVYFLDRSKSEKLIQHDPCLFCKNAAEKASKQMLIHFARETLAAVGDITKYLRCIGYVVNHSQSYIEEFEYGVQNLGVDLRDGVRLAKVMEIIQMRNDLTPRLRVPAISRLQKIHNMQLVFTSLKETGYEIMYDIIPKDIVDGHRNKTLSFLWQIIYKFEAPLMVKSATTVQTWFRSLPVQLKRRKLQRVHQCRESAAQKIQSWYRRQKKIQLYCALGKFLQTYINDQKQLRAVIKLQRFFRMIICRRNFEKQRYIIVKLQAYSKGWLIRHNYRRRVDAAMVIQKNIRRFICRRKFIRLRKAALTLQYAYLARKSMLIEKQKFTNLKRAVLITQRRFRAKLLMKNCHKEYSALREATIKIQSFYRMYHAKRQFTQLKSASITIQRRYRAMISMRAEKKYYLALRNAVLFVQRRFRANLLKSSVQKRFLIYRRSAIAIQSYYRMYRMRKYFRTLRKSVVFLQRTFTAKQLMKRDVETYRALKMAAITVQQQFRAKIKGRQDRLYYIQLKNAVVKIQQKHRANKLMLKNQQKYIEIRSATCKIQIWYRSLLSMRVTRHRYCSLKRNVLLIEQRFIALKLMRATRAQYQNIRNAALNIQRSYKATVEMRACRASFLELRRTVIILQRKIKAKQIMKKHRLHYEELRKAVLCIQRRYREKTETVLQRDQFIKQKRAAIRIQRWYRSVVEMRKCRNYFWTLKKAVTIIKSRYHATKQMKIAAKAYENLRKATISIQSYYRRVLIVRQCRKELLQKRVAAITIQRYFRNYQNMKVLNDRYQQLRCTTLFVQRTYRAKREMLQCKSAYESLRKAIVFIQTKYVAKKMMQIQRTEFLRYREAIVNIQRRYKANILMRQDRTAYVKNRKMAIIIQQKYRAIKAMRKEKSNFDVLKKYTILIQRRFRAKKMGKLCRSEYILLRSATVTVQSRFRATRSMLSCARQYSKLKWATQVIQRRFRAQTLMKLEMNHYLKIRSATCIIQRRFRDTVLMKIRRTWFLKLKSSVNIIEMYFLYYRKMKQQRQLYLKLHAGTLCIQKFARGYLARRKFAPCLTKEAIQMRREFKRQNAAATTIQAIWRGYVFRKLNISRLASLKKLQQRRFSQPKKSKTLAQRSEDAMTCMITKNSSLHLILAALEDLEFIVRHCREVSIRMSNILPDQLYSIIGAAARSLPEMNTINVATQILITFCKYPQTRQNSFNADYIDGMIGIMLHWCDKEAPLFLHLSLPIMEESCRICLELALETYRVPLSSLTKANKTVCQLIKECALIQICEPDKLPQHLCCKCYQQLLVMYDFRLPIKQEKKSQQKISYTTTSPQLPPDEKVKSSSEKEQFQQSVRKNAGRKPSKVAEKKRKVHEFKCEICKKVLVGRSNRLQQHIIMAHSDIRNFPCNICEKKFKSKQQLVNHSRVHTGEKPYKCDICKTAFASIQSLFNHKKKHTGNHKNYKCAMCLNKGYATPGELETHRRIVHTGEKPFLCELCSRAYSSLRNLVLHKKSVHEKTEKCPKCSLMLSNKRIKYHVQKHLDKEEGIRRYTCDQCGKSFFTQSVLKRHQLLHLNHRPYACQICHKAFSQKGSVETHMKTHSDIRSYSCSLCDKTFKYKQHLQQHLHKKHATSVESLLETIESERKELSNALEINASCLFIR